MNRPAQQAAPGRQVAPAKPRLVEIFADRYHVEPDKMMAILRATCFNTGKEPPATVEEVASLLVVANEYNLNPFTREIYAFRNKRTGGIVPIIGIDGWVRIVERQPNYDGEEMKSGYDDTLGPDGTPLGFYYECFIHRSDRKFPVSRRQYYRENVRDTEPWRQMPTRMLQHRAYIQSARAAFGLGGIYDEDEGEAIALAPGIDLLPVGKTSAPEPKKPVEQVRVSDAQLEHIRERLGVTGVPDNLVLARFEVGDFAELHADQYADVLKFIQDNAP